MALFEKKTCDICGDKLGLTGRMKVSDGVVCKYCAARLSVWTGDQPEATLREIRSQLVDREKNRQLVADFGTTRSYGETDRICFDGEKRRFMIVRTDNVTLENPDVFGYDDVVDCSLEVQEDRTEDMQKDEKGKPVSFHPPHFHYLFDFIVNIRVRHPWIDSVSIRLNRDSVSIPGGAGGVSAAERDAVADYRRFVNAADEIRGILTFRPGDVSEAPAAAEGGPEMDR